MIIFVIGLIIFEVGMIAIFIHENKEMEKENENERRMKGE